MEAETVVTRVTADAGSQGGSHPAPHLADAHPALSRLAGRTAFVAVAPDGRWSTLSYGAPDRQGRPAPSINGPLPAGDLRALLVRALSSVDRGAAEALKGLPADRYVSPSVPDEIKVRRFALGDRVRKRKGSSWRGAVVGFYSTELTPIGYCVESEREPGSVQIYPEAALELHSDQT